MQYCGGGETYTQAFGKYNINIARNVIGVWAQDDWKILPRLTLNLGLRYDNDLGAYNTSYVPTPGLLTPNTNPNLNFAPRLGFAYDPRGDGKTSIRGGAGLYYRRSGGQCHHRRRALQQHRASTAGHTQATLPLRSHCPAPFAGQNPTANPTGYVTTPQPVLRGAKTPYAFQASFGIARQLPWKTTMTADFVHMRVYDDFICPERKSCSRILQTLSRTWLQRAAITAANYATRVSAATGALRSTL